MEGSWGREPPVTPLDSAQPVAEERQKGRVSNFSTCRVVACGVAIAAAVCAAQRSGQDEGRRRLPTGPVGRKFAATSPQNLLYFLGELYDGVEWSAKNLEEKTDTIITPSDRCSTEYVGRAGFAKFGREQQIHLSVYGAQPWMDQERAAKPTPNNSLGSLLYFFFFFWFFIMSSVFGMASRYTIERVGDVCPEALSTQSVHT
jgi:hypothetical protein